MIVYAFASKRINIIECFIEIFQKLLNQDIRNRGHLINKKQTFYYRNTLDILLIIWIVLCSILINWFNTTLLNIYSTQKSVPFVQTLEDIINNENIKIGGKTSLNKFKNSNPEQFGILEKRLFTKTDYPSVYYWCINFTAQDDFYFHCIFHKALGDIVKGKLVYLFDSKTMKRDHGFAKRFYNMVIAEKKYFLDYYVSSIDKNYPYKDVILNG